MRKAIVFNNHVLSLLALKIYSTKKTENPTNSINSLGTRNLNRSAWRQIKKGQTLQGEKFVQNHDFFSLTRGTVTCPSSQKFIVPQNDKND
ncbi:hypothetical protein COI51_06675 [Bacillus toyonensis]|nr:hypothetical protein COL85_24150 [Bacillus toyonensis]PGB25845.1 hypothetical protein COM06_16115 [Bacillus toyonensis]PGC36192.1 hypothetical protein COM10_14560 [Bacillus toyonensis]PHF86186.1 hypothetical protein COI51_06675 [Bacillus toyonensis]PHG02032.1 hypothetical protein COI49_17435 [Bacillus toyonensis]